LPEKNVAVIEQRIPLDSSRQSLEEYVSACILAVNMHTHSFTCEKGNRFGGDEDCRMGYPRPIVSASHSLDNTDGQSFLLRRTDGMVIPYQPALFLACPCNHSINLTCEMSRYAREWLQYRDAVAAIKEGSSLSVSLNFDF
jgi:hypothetical protein